MIFHTLPASVKPLEAWKPQFCAQVLRIGEMLCSWPRIFKAPQELVDRTPLLVHRFDWISALISLPKRFARHPFPELETRQVYLVMACPGFVKIKNSRQAPLTLPVLKKQVVLVKIFVTQVCLTNVQEKMLLFL
jgi:hypothetical protein